MTFTRRGPFQFPNPFVHSSPFFYHGTLYTVDMKELKNPAEKAAEILEGG